MKLPEKMARSGCRVPAAFGRLRVETKSELTKELFELPAAFGRLRVETRG